MALSASSIRNVLRNVLSSSSTRINAAASSISRSYASAAQLYVNPQNDEVLLPDRDWRGHSPLPGDQTEHLSHNLVFLGCPGVGKGTYASRLARYLDVPHIAMGDLVRNELRRGTSLAKQMEATMSEGKLLPDSIVLDLLARRLANGAANGENGFILDGFPRNIAQADILEGITSIDLVVNLRLREDILMMKCLGRRICGECGKNFNIADINFKASDSFPEIVMPPLPPPPDCIAKMTQRTDDTENVIKERLKVYHRESRPVEEYYNKKGMLLNFDVLGGIPETWPRLLSELNLENKSKAHSQALLGKAA